MADLPILFSAPMVRAILREIEQPGTGKTQTRRVINPQPFAGGYYEGEIDCTSVPAQASNLSAFFRFGATAVGGGAVRTETWVPRYAVGDRLYVREAWRTLHAQDCLAPRHLAEDRSKVTYEADPENRNPLWAFGKFRQGMHMPKWASRITLIVTDVRVQRLQEISEADARAEGVVKVGRFYGVADADWDHASTVSRVDAYSGLWDSLNAARGYGWETNPWVAAYTFRPVLGNIDQLGGA